MVVAEFHRSFWVNRLRVMPGQYNLAPATGEVRTTSKGINWHGMFKVWS